MITVEIHEEPAFTHWPCVVCGGRTEKGSRIAEAPGVGIVCEDCLAAGPEAASEALRRHADELERRAYDLRRLAGEQWEMPSVAELHEREGYACP